MYVHLSFWVRGDNKKMGARAPWPVLSMGMVYLGIRERLNLIMEVNDPAN